MAFSFPARLDVYLLSKWLLTLIYVFISVFLTRFIPFSSFFRNLDTMNHEFSHAVIALLLSGRVRSIELHADHSGVTYAMLSSNWSSVLVSLAGYIGASLFSLLLFYFYRNKSQRTGLLVILAIALIMVTVFVKGGFGLYWLAGFIALTAFMGFINPRVRNIYYLLLAFLTLEESTVGSIYLIIASLNNSKAAGDASGLQSLTGIPALVWALLFTVVSLICATRSLRLFMDGWQKPRAAKTDNNPRYFSK